LIEFRRKAAQIQHNLMVFQLCRPVWNRWVELAQISGIFTGSPDGSDELQNVKWVPQGWDWVDPLKDQEAQKMAVRNGFKSRSEVVSEYGYDAEEIDDEIKKDNARADEIGVIFDSDSRGKARESRISYAEEDE
jgi:lambda family phage portal protein